MAVIPPVVRHVFLCRGVHRDPIHPNQLSIDGLITTIRSLEDPPFPLVFPQLTVCLLLTGGRGAGKASIEIRFADTGKLVFQTSPRTLTFGNDPLAVDGVVFNILGCPFPDPGLYLVQFHFEDQVLAQEQLTVR